MLNIFLSLLACASHHVEVDPTAEVAPPAPPSTVVALPTPKAEPQRGPDTIEVQAVAEVEPRGDDIGFAQSTETMRVAVTLSGMPEGAHLVEVRQGVSCGFSSARDSNARDSNARDSNARATATLGTTGGTDIGPVGAERTANATTPTSTDAPGIGASGMAALGLSGSGTGAAGAGAAGVNTAGTNATGSMGARLPVEETAGMAASNPELSGPPTPGTSAEEAAIAAAPDTNTAAHGEGWSEDVATVQVDHSGEAFVALSLDPSAINTGAVVVIDNGMACGVVASAK